MKPEFTEQELESDHDLEARKHEHIRRLNDARDLARTARENRRKGYPAPKVGDVLHVTLGRGLARRSRAGVTFTKGPSTAVEVLDKSAEDILELQKRGLTVVNPDGAERILADDEALVVRSMATSNEDADQAIARANALEEELASAREELAALRKARQSAPESHDGKPTRLPAAADAKANRAPKAPTAAAPTGPADTEESLFGKDKG